MIELYPHQKEAVEKLRTGSILCGGVGSGKSITAIAYYFCKVCGGSIEKNGKPYFHKMTDPRPLYIITTARKRDTLDWEHECVPFLLEPLVDSWNNIHKYEDVEDAFFIFDEQRVVGNGSWVSSFYKITGKNKWILLSATPGDTYMDYVPVFIANGFYKNRSQFIKRHVVYNRFVKFPKVDRYLETYRLDGIIKFLLVEMPFKRDTVRHYISVPVKYQKDKYDWLMENRRDPNTDEPFANIAQLCMEIRKVVNSDESRIEALLNILKKFSRVIIFYNYDYELEILKNFCDSNGYLYGEWNGHRHDLIPKDGSWIYLVQYNAGAEGWNCVETNCIIFYSQNYSYKMTEQACGRIDRLNTLYVDLYYYTLISDSPIDEAIKKCLSKKKNFNEKNFINTKSQNLMLL